MHVEIEKLPREVRSVLAEVGFNRKDIVVEARETYTVDGPGGDGYREFTAAVNLETGERKIVYGSWGGANIFNPRNAVDLDRTARPMLPNMVVIKGREGGGRPVYAYVQVHPSTLAPLLPAPVDLDEKDRKALGYIKSYTPKYRPERFRAEDLGEYSAKAPRIARLIAAGFLSANKAGAISITTAGKNLAARVS